MAEISTFLRYYRAIHGYIGNKALILGLVSAVTTLTEGLGIALFFAYLQSLAGGNVPSGVILKLESILQRLGLPSSSTSIVLTMIAVFILRGVLVLARNSYQFRLYIELMERLTKNVIDELGQMSYLDYLKYDSAYFTHLATAEVENAVRTFYQIAALIPSFVSITIYLALSLKFEWRFTLFAIFFGGAMWAIYRGVTWAAKSIGQELSVNEVRKTSMLIQFLHGFKYLLSTGNTEVVRTQIKKYSTKVAVAGSRLGVMSAIIPATSEPLIVLFVSLCIYYQSQILHREIAPVLVSLMFLYRVMKESTTGQNAWQTLLRHGVGLDRIEECIKEIQKNRPIEGQVEITHIQKGISLDHVSFGYGDKNVLNDITLEIPARSMIALVGESGAGKSTLVDLIAGSLLPSGGKIMIDGISYTELNRESLRRKIGYVTQDSVIFDDTVANNISLWSSQVRSQSGDAEVELALKQAQAESFVKQMPNGLQQVLGDRGVRLSGGQKQRISIARELYRQPELLILDEATSALDSESEAAIQKSIESMKGKATVIIIAHRLATVKGCDQIFILEQGRVVDSGSFHQLLGKSTAFKRMCEIQSLT